MQFGSILVLYCFGCFTQFITTVTTEYYRGKQRRQRDLTRRKHKDIQFVFDRVFDEQTDNQEIYESTTRGILDGVLDGYNCSGECILLAPSQPIWLRAIAIPLSVCPSVRLLTFEMHFFVRGILV